MSSFFCTEFAGKQWTEILYIPRKHSTFKFQYCQTKFMTCKSSTLTSALHHVTHTLTFLWPTIEYTSMYSLFPFFYKVASQVNFSNFLVCISYKWAQKITTYTTFYCTWTDFLRLQKSLILIIQKHGAGLFWRKLMSFKGRTPGMNSVFVL